MTRVSSFDFLSRDDRAAPEEDSKTGTVERLLG